MTGLPPTPDEVSSFLADNSPNAYEKVVDRLLASPHYGEHEARYWLDAARYAETAGLHIDEPRSIWPYRDWVIKAFNDNKRFNDFVVEQVAGDLLPNHTIDQQVATGFTRCGISTSEGAASRTRSSPAMRRNTSRPMPRHSSASPWAAAPATITSSIPSPKRNSTNSPPSSGTPRNPPSARAKAPMLLLCASRLRKDRARWDALPAEQAAAQKAMDDYELAFAAHSSGRLPAILHDLGASKPDKPVGPEGLELELPLHDGTGNQITSAANTSYTLSGNPQWTTPGLLGPAAQLDGSVYAELGNVGDFERSDKFSFGCWIRTTGTAQGAVFARMDRNDNFRGWDLWLDNGRPAPHFINSWPRNALQTETKDPLTPNKWQHVFVTYDGSGKPAGVKIYIDGMEQETKPVEKTLDGPIRTTTQLTFGRRESGDGAVAGVAVQDLRIYRRVLTAEEVKALAGSETVAAMLQTPPDKFNAIQQRFALKYYLRKVDPGYAVLRNKAAGLKAEYDAISDRSPTTMVMDEKPTPPFAFLLKRGQYDQKGEKLSPGVPKVLPPMPKDAPDNRLGLAKWLVAPENPLLARVTVNRFWQQFFGIGIVRTAEDFGIMGERPSQSAVARLDGCRVPRIGLGRETHDQAHGHVRGLPAIRPDHPGEAG